MATALNLYFARRFVGYGVQWGYVGRLFLSGAAMAGTAWILHHSLLNLLGNTLATIIAMSAAVTVYLIGIFAFRAIAVTDLEKLPVIGPKLASIAEKLGK